MAEHDAVGLLDVELGARSGDVDDPGNLADGPVQMTGQPIGTADEPGAAVVGVGADRRAPVSLDGRDEDPADDGHHSRSRAEFAAVYRGVTAPYSFERGPLDIPRDDSPPDPTGSPTGDPHEVTSKRCRSPGDDRRFRAGLERIGSGGFSVVYRARQQSMNREVAIKVLNTGFATDAERRTFERECHALGQLSHHPNIVTVFDDAITDDGRPCIVMELYSSTYRERVEEIGPLPIDEVLAVGVRICGALQTAHDAGVLHRDIKPHNIFLSAYGEPALGDFGISTIDDERSHSGASGVSVAYAAPEMLEDSRRVAGGRRVLAGGDVVPLDRRRFAVRQPRHEDDRAADPHRGAAAARSAGCPARARPRAPPGARQGSGRTPGVGGRARRDDPRGAGPGRVRPHADPAPHRRRHRVQSASPAPNRISASMRPHRAATRRAAGAPPRATAASGAPVSTDAAESADSGVTIARARPAGTSGRAADDAVSGPGARRRWIAIGAAAAAVVAVTIGVLALGGDDDGASPPSTAGVIPTDPFFEVLAPPSDVAIVAVGDGSFQVSYVVPEGVASVEIEYANGPDANRIVSSNASPAVVESASPTLCVSLRSIGPAGRVSTDFGPVCSG